MRFVSPLAMSMLVCGCMAPTGKTVSGEDAMTVIANRCAGQLGISLPRPIKADWNTSTNAVGFDYPQGLTEDQKLKILFCTQDKAEQILARR